MDYQDQAPAPEAASSAEGTYGGLLGATVYGDGNPTGENAVYAEPPVSPTADFTSVSRDSVPPPEVTSADSRAPGRQLYGNMPEPVYGNNRVPSSARLEVEDEEYELVENVTVSAIPDPPSSLAPRPPNRPPPPPSGLSPRLSVTSQTSATPSYHNLDYNAGDGPSSPSSSNLDDSARGENKVGRPTLVCSVRSDIQCVSPKPHQLQL